MAKKLLAALLALSLLTACGGEAASAPIPAPDPTPTPVQTPRPSVTSGGYTVQTDYSRYTPYERPAASYTRLSGEWIGDLAPSGDYGMLYPFVGTRLYSSYDNAYLYESGALYGLFDESGRIVADPVYTEVTPAGYYDYERWKTVYVPMLRLGRGNGDEMVYAIATLDGSFVTDCRYAFVRAMAFGVLCAESYNAEEFVLYDFEGNVLLTEKDMKLGDLRLEMGANSISGVGLDLLLLDLTDGDYFMDLSGELVCGPYDVTQVFSDGYAVIWEARGTGMSAGLVDTSGNRVLPSEYRAISQGHDGAFIALRTESSTVYSGSGEEIFTAEGVLAMTDYGYTNGDICYLKDGSVAPFSGEGWISIGTPSVPVLYRVTEEGDTELMDHRSGRTLTLEGEYYVTPVYENWVMGPQSSLEYMYCYVPDPNTSLAACLVSWDLERTVTLGDTVSLGMAGVCSLSDKLTGEEYLVLNDSDGSRTVYTAELEPLFTSTESAAIYNGRVIVTDGQSCTCTDFEGNVLFRCPLILPDGD